MTIRPSAEHVNVPPDFQANPAKLTLTTVHRTLVETIFLVSMVPTTMPVIVRIVLCGQVKTVIPIFSVRNRLHVTSMVVAPMPLVPAIQEPMSTGQFLNGLVPSVLIKTIV